MVLYFKIGFDMGVERMRIIVYNQTSCQKVKSIGLKIN